MLPNNGGRGRLWWAFVALHMVMVLWWPFSIIAAVYSVGAVASWQTGYLIWTALLYPAFIGAAVRIEGRVRHCGAVARVLALSIPFLSGTWITAVILIPALLAPVPGPHH